MFQACKSAYRLELVLSLPSAGVWGFDSPDSTICILLSFYSGAVPSGFFKPNKKSIMTLIEKLEELQSHLLKSARYITWLEVVAEELQAQQTSLESSEVENQVGCSAQQLDTIIADLESLGRMVENFRDTACIKEAVNLLRRAYS